MSTRFTSTLRVILSGLVITAGALPATSLAQGTQRRLKVTIPFAFQEGKAHLSPGVYTIGMRNPPFMVIEGAWGTTPKLALVSTDQGNEPAAASKIIFRRYGDQYFLREIWMAGTATHLICPPSKAEKSRQKELQLAGNQRDASGTEVALLETLR